MAAKKRFSLADRLVNEQQIEDAPIGGLFAEEPVDLDTFIHDRAYLNQPDIVLGEHQYNLIRHMEQIYLPSMYPYMVREFGEYWTPVDYVNRIIVQWGKGSGKDMSVQYAIARIAYLLLCLDNPQKYFDLSEQSDIQLLNIAMNAAQARRAFFKPLGTLIKKSRWFADDKVKNDITDQATYIRLDKQIELVSGHSLAENFEGLSPLAVVLDEISGFQSEELKLSRGITESNRTAEAVYDIVRTSASTRFPHNYKLAAISYPRYLHDPIQNLCQVGREDLEINGADSIYWVDGPRATWEVNPRFRNEEFVKIPETDILVPNIKTYLEDYRNDAAEARAKYECRPERAVNRFMRNDSALAQAFPKQGPDWIEPLKVFYHWGIDTEGAKAEDSYELATVPNWQVEYQFGPQLRPIEGGIYALHADLAVNGDRAGISMCHVRNWERREHVKGDDPARINADYQSDYRPVVKVDFVTYYEANLQAVADEDGLMHPREIQLRWFRNLVRELRRRGFTIGRVTLDTYQSVDTIQILTSWGIESDDLSMDRNAKPYTNLREVIYDGRLEGYYNDILQVELEGLNQLPNGKINHPPQGSKDLADALCGAVVGAIELGGDEGLDPEEVDVNYGIGVDYTPYQPWALTGNYGVGIRPSDLAFPGQ